MSREKRPLIAVPDPAPVRDELHETLRPAPTQADELLTIDEVAAILKVHRATVYTMVARGVFPRSIAIDGGRPSVDRAATRRPIARWSSNEVQAWIAGQLAHRAG